MKIFSAFRVGVLLLTVTTMVAFAQPAPTLPTKEARGKIATWYKESFSVQPAQGKAATFLVSKTTRVEGKPVVGGNAVVRYFIDKSGKNWATGVKVEPGAKHRR